MAVSTIRRIYEYEPAYPIEMSAGSIEKQNTAWTKVILEIERIYRLINSEFAFFKDLINDLIQWITDVYTDLDKRLNKLDLPIGTIVAYSGDVSYIPNGWHLCDGTGGTPDLRNQFLMGAGVNSKGDFISAGLPNVRGGFVGLDVAKDSASWWSGAMELVSYHSPEVKFQVDDSTSPAMSVNEVVTMMDASRSNPIYGNSTTVQPPAYVVYYIMRVS